MLQTFVLLDVFFCETTKFRTKSLDFSRNKMTTDYKNLNYFEAAAVSMIAVGIALIGFQFFIALPTDAQSKVVSALQVFEMSEPLEEVWSVQVAVNEHVFDGVGDFYDEVYVAIGEIALPVADDIEATVKTYARMAQTVAVYSDTLAANYQSNYVSSGVEASMGGRVMGAFVERLSE